MAEPHPYHYMYLYTYPTNGGEPGPATCLCSWNHSRGMLALPDGVQTSSYASANSFDSNTPIGIDCASGPIPSDSDGTWPSLLAERDIFTPSWDEPGQGQIADMRYGPVNLETQVWEPAGITSRLEVPWAAGRPSKNAPMSSEDRISSIPNDLSDIWSPLLSGGDCSAQGAQSTVPSTSPQSSTLVDDDNAMIGSFHKNGKLKCNQKRCGSKTFGRSAELKRHYDTIHATNKAEFWCIDPFCERSIAGGGRPFRRRDKLRDHVSKKHELG